jgi:hypothetical protein
MTNQTTYWSKVLSHYERKRYYNNGLTIPFLIGSRTILEPHEKSQTVSEFLNDLRSSNQCVTMMKCDTLKEYVIGLLDSETNLMRKQYPKLYNELGSIIITDGSFAGVADFQDIITRLEDDYNEMIKNQTFSKDIGQWGYFSKVDQSRLNEVISAD